MAAGIVDHGTHLRGQSADAFADGRRRVLVVDYSGSGDTADDGTPLSLGGLAAQVRAVIDDAGGRNFDLLGFSLGACVATELAAHHPAGLRRLVLLSGWAASEADARMGLQFGLWRHLHATDRRALAELLTLTGFSPNYLAARPSKVLAQAVERTIATLAPGFERQCELDERIALTSSLGAITVPTLVLGATHDQMVPVHHAHALAAGIAGAAYEELPTGHLSLFEAPDQLVAATLAFLGG
jgi:3-oxoadipate enol-lactonase